MTYRFLHVRYGVVGASGIHHRDGECGLQSRLIEAGEGLAGIGGFEFRSRNSPVKVK